MPWGPTCAGECVSISCRNSEARTTGEDRTTERRQPRRRRPRTIMRIQVARTHSYASPFSFFLCLCFSLSIEASCLLTQFLAFLRPLRRLYFILRERILRPSTSPRPLLLLFLLASLLLLLLALLFLRLLLLPLLEAMYRLVAFQSLESGRTSSR